MVQIPCICCVNGFTRFKRGGKRVQVVSNKFELKTIRFMQFLNEVNAITSITEDLVGTSDFIS